jgi:hypothetical protein
MGAWTAFLTWLGEMGLSAAMRGSPWLYPAAETVHLLGLALLVGAAAVFDLRLLGVSPRWPVAEAAAQLLPKAHAGLLVAAVSGAALFAADPLAMWENPAFRVKLALLALAGLNAAAFHAGPFRSLTRRNALSPLPPSARLAAVCSLLLWAAIVAAGRLIGYLE